MLHAFVHAHYMLSFVSVLAVAATARIIVLLIFESLGIWSDRTKLS